jgi:hypothetical protein
LSGSSPFPLAAAEGAAEVEKYDLSEDPDADESAILSVRDLSALDQEDTRILSALVGGCAPECEADAELVEALHRQKALDLVVPMALARPPLSTAALRLLRCAADRSTGCASTG